MPDFLKKFQKILAFSMFLCYYVQAVRFMSGRKHNVRRCFSNGKVSVL